MQSFEDVLGLAKKFKAKSTPRKSASDTQAALMLAIRQVIKPTLEHKETIHAPMREINFQLLETSRMPFDGVDIFCHFDGKYRQVSRANFWKECRKYGVHPRDTVCVTIYWG